MACRRNEATALHCPRWWRTALGMSAAFLLLTAGCAAPIEVTRVDPRDVPKDRAARRLGLSVADFEAVEGRLYARGFPRPDPDTGLFDLKAVENWMDRRSGLATSSAPRDAVIVARSRLEALGGGTGKEA